MRKVVRWGCVSVTTHGVVGQKTVAGLEHVWLARVERFAALVVEAELRALLLGLFEELFEVEPAGLHQHDPSEQYKFPSESFS